MKHLLFIFLILANFTLVEGKEKYSVQEIEKQFSKIIWIQVIHSWNIAEISPKKLRKNTSCVTNFKKRFFIYWDKKERKLLAWSWDQIKIIFEPIEENFTFGEHQVFQMKGYSTDRENFPEQVYWLKHCPDI